MGTVAINCVWLPDDVERTFDSKPHTGSGDGSSIRKLLNQQRFGGVLNDFWKSYFYPGESSKQNKK